MDGMDIYYSATKLILKLYQGIFSQDSHIRGELPLQPGAKIIAANHANVTDGFFLPFVIQEKLHFFVQGDLLSIPFFGWLLAKSGQIPVWPDQKKAALEKAHELLAAGKTVVIFPEGKLNPDSQPTKAYTGTVRLSLMTGAAIIPVGFHVPRMYLKGRTIQKNGKPTLGFWQSGGRCFIRIGLPWLPSHEMRRKAEETAITELTIHLMSRIKALVELAALDSINEHDRLPSDASLVK
jgi:1-acyl-sn-glycerol-3-phosphate acyltransferase